MLWYVIVARSYIFSSEADSFKVHVQFCIPPFFGYQLCLFFLTVSMSSKLSQTDYTHATSNMNRGTDRSRHMGILLKNVSGIQAVEAKVHASSLVI